MPIHGESQYLYRGGYRRKAWREFAERIKREAGYRCQHCGAVRGDRVVWLRPAPLPLPHDILPIPGIWEFRSTFPLPESPAPRIVQLHVAHLDQDPTNDQSARALCRRCHLAWDRRANLRRAACTRERRRSPRTAWMPFDGRSPDDLSPAALAAAPHLTSSETNDHANGPDHLPAPEAPRGS